MFLISLYMIDAVLVCCVVCNQQSHLCKSGRGSDPELYLGGTSRNRHLLTFPNPLRLSGSDHLENHKPSQQHYRIKFITKICVWFFINASTKSTMNISKVMVWCHIGLEGCLAFVGDGFNLYLILVVKLLV